jgi:Flp pilus assembly protein TadD
MKSFSRAVGFVLVAGSIMIAVQLSAQAQSDRVIVNRPGDPLDRDVTRPDRNDYELRTSVTGTPSQVEAALKYAKEAFEAKPPQYLDAEKHYLEAAKLNPKDERAYVGLGTVYAAQDEVKEAVAAFQKAIEIKPKQPVPHFNLGVIYVAIGKKAEALQQQTALESLDAKLAKKLKDMIEARFKS